MKCVMAGMVNVNLSRPKINCNDLVPMQNAATLECKLNARRRVL